MDKTSFETLIQDQPLDIKAKGSLLFNGVLQGKVAYQKEPIASKLKDWKVSKEALDDFINSLSSTPTNEETFRGIPAVVKYLTGRGWKISLRTGYNHRDKKILLPRKDGKYYQSDVDRYASSGELQRLDGTKNEVVDADTDRKRKAEADSAEYDARIKRIRAEAIEGKYIDRETFDYELSSQALEFRNAMQTFIYSEVEDMVNFVGGNIAMIPDLIERMIIRADEHIVKCAEQIEQTGTIINPGKIEAEDSDPADEEEGLA